MMRESTMVGRDAELDLLRRLWTETEHGEPRIAVVAGEAGLGKSRLVDAFRHEVAAEPGAVVAIGQCVEVTTVPIPYAPLAGVFRALGRELGMDAVIEAAGPGAAALRRLASGEPAARGSAAAAMRLDEVITTVLETLSAQHRLLVIVEDLHWADPATLDVVRFATRVQRTGRLLVVLTFRDDAPRDQAFREFVADLDRNPRSTRVTLQRLSPREVRAQVHDLLGSVPAAEFARRIHERSDGIPFFVEELVALGASDDAVPPPLRDVLLGRYESLTPAAQKVARMLAASEVGVEHSVLAQIGDIGSLELDDSVRQAVEAGLIRAEGRAYHFRHALTREAVAAELLPGELERVHARYAELLESEGDDGTRTSRTVRIANHWFESGDAERAFTSALAGMAASLDAFAYAGAARLGERAAELWDRVPDASGIAGRTRPELLVAVAGAWRVAGEAARAQLVVEGALAALPFDTGSSLRATLLHDRALLQVDRSTAIRDLEAAVSLLDQPGDRVQRAAVQADLASQYMIAGRGDDAVRVASEVLATAPAQARRSRSFAANMRGSTLLHRGSIEAGLVDFETARADAGDDTDALIRYHINFSDALFMLGRHVESIEVAEAGLEVATAAGVERTMGSMLALNIVDPLFAIGDWDRADLLIERSLDEEPPGSFRAYLRRASIRSALWRGNLPGALDSWREWASSLEAVAQSEGQARANQAIDFADLHLAAGDLDLAWTFASQLLEEPPLGSAPQELPLAPTAARVIASRRRETGERDLQAAEERRIFDVVDRDGWPTQALWRALAAAELGGADGAGSDPELWMSARVAADTPEAPVLSRLLVEFGLARSLVAIGKRTAAAAVLEELRTTAEGVGAGLVLQWADLLGQSAGLLGRGRSARVDSGGLTGRERQVFDLVAEGLTNVQVAERLFLSPKTVSVHVSAILRKLGAATRTEAVRVWMLRQEGS